MEIGGLSAKITWTLHWTINLTNHSCNLQTTEPREARQKLDTATTSSRANRLISNKVEFQHLGLKKVQSSFCNGASTFDRMPFNKTHFNKARLKNWSTSAQYSFLFPKWSETYSSEIFILRVLKNL